MLQHNSPASFIDLVAVTVCGSVMLKLRITYNDCMSFPIRC